MVEGLRTERLGRAGLASRRDVTEALKASNPLGRDSASVVGCLPGGRCSPSQAGRVRRHARLSQAAC